MKKSVAEKTSNITIFPVIATDNSSRRNVLNLLLYFISTAANVKFTDDNLRLRDRDSPCAEPHAKNSR